MRTMKHTSRFLTLSIAAMIAAATAQAQISNIRPADQRGINVFETPKTDSMPFTKLAFTWGGTFTQDFQNLTHSNTSTPVMVGTVNSNALMPIGSGFTTSMANLNFNIQLARGIRTELEMYLSTRHHTDTWVKGGYIQIDASPWDIPVLNDVMKMLTIRIGQYENNYGDSHYRRTDAGNGMYNPFVGNLIVDAFTTEIGGDVTFQHKGFILMGGITGGTSQGQVQAPGKHQPAYLAKIGFDRQITEDLRVRLTGSMYNDAKSTSNVLLNGDRGGSHYFDVMESATSTEASAAWSGTIQPGFSNRVAAYVVNPFVKYRNVEFFGNIETITGGTAAETTDRTWRQLSGDVVVRFLPRDMAYLGARYNKAQGALVGLPGDVDVQRTQVGFGLFITRNVLAKVEWVNQNYNGWPTTGIRNGGNFKGLMFEGAVGF